MKSTRVNCKSVASALAFGLLVSPAFAHTGHIEATSDGHSHLLALGAVCVALIVGSFWFLHNLKAARLKTEKLK